MFVSVPAGETEADRSADDCTAVVVSESAPELLKQHSCKACINELSTARHYLLLFFLFCFFAFREAMLLGPASTAVQRAGAGRSGRPCQQADGQVCRKVSTETALPVREGTNNGGKILGPNSPPIHFHTF